MYGKDYYQIVDTDLDDKYAETDEIKNSLDCILDEIKHSSRDFRENHIDLIGAIETYIDSLEDELVEIEQEINEQMDSVDSSWCD